jgi:NAD-dependent SIR2 family protein deacetylase
LARCYICDSYIERPTIDPKTNKIRHCDACDNEIQEAVGDFDEDSPEALLVDFLMRADDQ